MKKQLAIAAVCAIACGCTVRRITLGGNSYVSWRLGNTEKIGSIEVREGTNVFVVQAYESDQVQALSAVTSAAVSAAINGVK